MTIRSRLQLNTLISSLIIMLFFGTVFWAARSYQALQSKLDIQSREYPSWITLYAEMNYFLKESFEVLVTGRNLNDSLVEHKIAFHKSRVRTAFNSIQKILDAEKEANDPSYEEAQARLREAQQIFDAIVVSLKEGINLSNQSRGSGVKFFQTKISIFDKKANRLLMAGISEESVETQELQLQMYKLASKTAYFLATIFVLFLIINIEMGRRITKSIWTSLDQFLVGIAAIGEGRLDFKFDLNAKNELSVIGHALNHMTEDLKNSRQTIHDQQQKMLVSSKMSALGEMAGGVAHEINNPLAILTALVEQLQELVNDDVPDREMIRELSQNTTQTLTRIAQIVAGLRTFSRDGSRDSMHPTDISKTVRSTLDFCSERFRQHGVDLRVSGLDKEVTLFCRSTQISQVILNLLNNAYDAVADLPEKWVELSVVTAGSEIQIRVRDSGRGIPHELRKKIFQPFFTTKEVGKGTGLGLSISIGIVESHGGGLFLDDSSSNTCFVIRLPLTIEKSEAPSQSAAA